MRPIFMLAILLMAGVSFSVDVAGCQDITAPGTYVLTTDLSGTQISGDYCLEIQSSDVIVNCNGHSIRGTGSGVGIYSGVSDNVSITGCSEISGYSTGIRVSGTTANHANNVRISAGSVINNNAYGVIITNADNINLTLDSVADNGWEGLFLENVSGGTATLSASGNSQGMSVRKCHAIAFTGIEILSNDNIGIEVINSDNNYFASGQVSYNAVGISISGNSSDNQINNITLENNFANGIIVNGENGYLPSSSIYDSRIRGSANAIYVSKANGTAIIRNNISDSSTGISLSHNSGNMVIYNKISSISGNGIVLDESSNNQIVSNEIMYTGLHGVYTTPFSNWNSIRYNQISNTVNSGIWLGNSRNNSVLNNSVSDTLDGIVSYLGSGDNEILNNTISSVTSGITVYGGDGATTIKNNEIAGTGSVGYGISLKSALSTNMSKNTISYFAIGIDVKGININITDDDVSNCNHGIVVNGYNSIKLTSTHCNHNFYDGIVISDSTGVSVDPPVSCYNGNNGLTIRNSSDVTVDGLVSCENGNAGIEVVNAVNSQILNSELTGNPAGLLFDSLATYEATTLENNSYSENTENVIVGISECSHITAPGTYQLSNDLTGAPYQYYFYDPGYGVTWTYYACIKIDSDDVVLDCNNHIINGSNYVTSPPNYVLTAAIWSNKDNVVIQNCPGISNYTHGIDGENATISVTNSVFSNLNGSAIDLYYDNAAGSTGTDNATFSNLVFKNTAQALNVVGYWDVGVTDVTIENLSTSALNLYHINNTISIERVDATNIVNGGYLYADNVYVTNSNFNGVTDDIFGSTNVRYNGLFENNTFGANNTRLNINAPYSGVSSPVVVVRSNVFSNGQITGQHMYASNLVHLLLENNTFVNGGRGIYLYQIKNFSASNNRFENLGKEGIQGYYVNQSTITGNTFKTVSGDNIALYHSSNATVDDVLSTGPGYGSALRLDSCLNNKISNIEINGAGRTNNPVYMANSNNSEISNAKIYNSVYSTMISAYNCNDLFVHDVEISNSTTGGSAAISLGGDGIVVKNAKFNRTYYGLAIHSSKNVLVDNMTVTDPVYVGIYLSDSYTNITFDNNVFSGAGFDPANIQLEGAGIHSYTSNYSGSNNRFYNNRHDLLIKGNFFNDSITHVDLANSIFDNPAGSMTNFSNVSIYATVSGKDSTSPYDIGEAIVINWTNRAVPAGNISFNNMWVSVKNHVFLWGDYVYQNASIDSFTMSWTADQEAGYNMSTIRMLQDLDGTWVILDETPVSKSMSAENLGAGDVALFAQRMPVSSCIVIPSSGQYELGADLTGAPNPTSFGSNACIRITSSDVVLDCKGHKITGDGTSNGIGIAFDKELTNVQVRNCEISDYTANGIFVYASNNSVIENVKVHSNLQAGITMMSGADNLITDSKIYNNNGNGVSLGNAFRTHVWESEFSNNSGAVFIGSGGNNTVLNNDISENANYNNGIYVGGSNYNVIAGNNIRTSGYGINLGGAQYTSVTGNNIYDNSYAGIILGGVQSNNMADNVITNNSVGIKTSGSSWNNLTNNEITGNLVAGLNFSGGNNNWLLVDDEIHGNGIGVVVEQGSQNDVFRNTHFYNNEVDIYAAPSSATLNLSNVIFDNPSGNYQNFSNLSVNDYIPSGTSPYEISWTSMVSSPGYLSFHYMWLRIEAVSETSIDSIIWHWTDAQAAGYNESRLQLWKYDGAWSQVPATLDAAMNTLSVSTLNANGVFGIVYQGISDSDGDGVPDSVDKCPGTILPDTVQDTLRPNHYICDVQGNFLTNTGSTKNPVIGNSNYTIVDTYGCSCAQILYCKPGGAQGEQRFGCTSGTLSIWINQEAWARDCQIGGIVAMPGEAKSIFEDTDGSLIPDILDGDDDNDGVWDVEDSEPDSKPDAKGNPTGKPDWWCAKNPSKC
ncbi:right-handed parallel beta-helix repeat-containing protein [Candidatus Micrarchaeota archaeon]|nr:right-handed parallel beta-helix repeat-containing protein [Candidatus Micrarchaeota archaeon]